MVVNLYFQCVESFAGPYFSREGVDGMKAHGPRALGGECMRLLLLARILDAGELPLADDFIAPALYFEKFRKAALDHLGGSPDHHDAALFNRLTGATYATHLTLVKPGDVVIGVSASYSHPSVVRAVAQAGAKLVDTRGVDAFVE